MLEGPTSSQALFWESRCLFLFLLLSLSNFGILPGWHGMENGQKPEMEKKNGNRNGKRSQAGGGQKWPKNGKIIENSLKNPFLGHFFAIFAPVQLGAVFHFDFHFFSISGFWPFSTPCQPGGIPSQIQNIVILKRMAIRPKLHLPVVQMALHTEKNDFQFNYACHSRYRYRRFLFWH